MPELHFCLDCCTQGPLNQHGRCSTCDSSAVLSRNAERMHPEATLEEAIWLLGGLEVEGKLSHFDEAFLRSINVAV